MASGFGSLYADPQLDHMFRAQAAPTYPATLYVAAFTASNASSFLKANDIASAGEVSTSGTSYGRIQIMNGTSILFNAAAANQVVSNSDIVWSAAASSWGTVYAIALMTTATAATGDVVAYGDLATARAVGVPDVLRIPAGQLIIAL